MAKPCRLTAVITLSFVFSMLIANAAYADCRTEFNSAKASYDHGNFEASAAGFKEVVQNYRNCALASEALYMLGQSLEKQDKTKGAIEAYSILIRFRPDSNFAKRAEERISKLSPGMTEKDIIALAERSAKSGQAADSQKKPQKTVAGIDWGTFWSAVGVIFAIIISLTGWYFSRKKRKSVSRFMNEIDNTYGSFKMKSRRCEAELYRLKDMVTEELKKGRIDENAFTILEKRIEDYMKEVREQILNEKFGSLPSDMKKNLQQMLKDGQISGDEYEKFNSLLKKTGGIEEDEKKELSHLVKKWRDKDKRA